MNKTRARALCVGQTRVALSARAVSISSPKGHLVSILEFKCKITQGKSAGAVCTRVRRYVRRKMHTVVQLTSKASLSECILIRSRSLLSSLLRVRSRADIPLFRLRVVGGPPRLRRFTRFGPLSLPLLSLSSPTCRTAHRVQSIRDKRTTSMYRRSARFDSGNQVARFVQRLVFPGLRIRARLPSPKAPLAWNHRTADCIQLYGF